MQVVYVIMPLVEGNVFVPSAQKSYQTPGDTDHIFIVGNRKDPDFVTLRLIIKL
jgi:hypothetical protein